jgi:hypothetical protein
MNALDELIEAIADEAGGGLLDNLGITVRVPPAPQPVPPEAIVERLTLMYGNRTTAYRTAVAMERRRSGWTREGARLEFQRNLLASIEGSTR